MNWTKRSGHLSDLLVLAFVWITPQGVCKAMSNYLTHLIRIYCLDAKDDCSEDLFSTCDFDEYCNLDGECVEFDMPNPDFGDDD